MPSYRSHSTFNQTLLSNLSEIQEGHLKLTSVSKIDVINSQSSLDKTSNSKDVKSYNEGPINETD